MRRILNCTLVPFLCIFLLTACNQKQRAINNLSDFVEKVHNQAPDYSKEDWAKIDKEYNELIAEIEKYHDYTEKENERIAELKGEYTGIKTKNNVNKLLEDIKKAANELKGTIKGFTKGIAGETEVPQN